MSNAKTLLTLIVFSIFCTAPADSWMTAVGATSAATLRQGSSPAAADPLSGDWNAVAYYDSEVLFSLSLKVEGRVVTGTVSTAEGTGELRNGTWEDGTFSFETNYRGGPVAMSATIADGKLEGTWSYNGGEAGGRWQASRKSQGSS